MSVTGEKEILKRIEDWDGKEVIPLTAPESFYYRRHVVRRRFAFMCVRSKGVPTTGYFFPDVFPYGKLVDMHGHIDLKAPPCEAIRVQICDLNDTRAPNRLKKPEFTAGILTLARRGEVEFDEIAYYWLTGPQVIPYWQAKTWNSAGLSLALSPDSKRRLKKAGGQLFEPLNSVTNKLSEKQKILLVISLLYPYWAEHELKLSVRAHHIQETGLKRNLAPSDLKNYCAESCLEPLSRSQFFKRISAITKASEKYFIRYPDALLDVEEEPGIEAHKRVRFYVPLRRNSQG